MPTEKEPGSAAQLTGWLKQLLNDAEEGRAPKDKGHAKKLNDARKAGRITIK